MSHFYSIFCVWWLISYAVLIWYFQWVNFSSFRVSCQNSFTNSYSCVSVTNSCHCRCEEFSKQFAFSCCLFFTHLTCKGLKLIIVKSAMILRCNLWTPLSRPATTMYYNDVSLIPVKGFKPGRNSGNEAVHSWITFQNMCINPAESPLNWCRT